MSTPINGQKAPAHIVSPAGPSFGPSGFISPDMILQYVSNRLYGTDEQMNKIMSQQRKMEADGAILSELANDLGRGEWQQLGVTKENVAQVEAAWKKALDAAGGPETELGKKIMSAKSKFDASNGDKVHSKDDMKGYLEEVNRIQSDLSRGGEMMMMKLQSLASQRQQILTFATNTIAGLGETAKTIAANTGK